AVIGGAGINIGFAYTPSLPTPPSPATFVLRNSIVAGNTTVTGPPNCMAVNATIVSQGGNVSDTGECPFTPGGDLRGTEPLLTAFGNHGGPTDTFDLKKGSPAIDRGHDCPSVDQRDVARNSSTCDSGAVEHTGGAVKGKRCKKKGTKAKQAKA